MLRLATFLCLLCSPAKASLVVCNALSEPASVAVGYAMDGVWVSEGWWNTQPGSCLTLIDEDLDQRFYYWRAELFTGPLVEGAYRFCSLPVLFTIEGDEDCEARGYRSSLFNRVDTGSALSHAITLTLPD
jgi:uncharacterized membrane protein